MPKRALVMTVATAAALVVVLLTLMAKPPAPKQVAATGPSTGEGFEGTFDPANPPKARGLGATIGPAHQIAITRVDEHGHVIELEGSPVNPRPNGLFDVGHPTAVDHSSPQRAVRFSADSGAFYAPQQQLRRGDMHGNVLANFFEAPPGKPVELTPNSPENKLRMYMHDAHFDLDLGQITTDGPVHLTGPQLDFVGRGMQMTYQQQDRRIALLEVAETKWLRLQTRQPASTQPATTSPSGKHTGDTAAPPAAVQYYLATITGNVKIQHRQVRADADVLTMIFSPQGKSGKGDSLGRGGATPGMENADATPGTMVAMTAEPLRAAVLAMTQSLMAATPAVPAARVARGGPSATEPEFPIPAAGQVEGEPTMAPPSPEDMTITWTGTLTVVPLSPEQTPPEMSSPDDRLLALHGLPVHIITAHGETIEGTQTDYLASLGRVHVVGNRANPMRIVSQPMAAVMTGKSLVMDQSHADGRIEGPGLIRAFTPAEAAEAKKNQPAGKETSKQLPPGFALRWTDNLDLTFYMDHPWNSKARHELVQAKAIKTATFHGDVVMNDPDVDLLSDQLALALDPAARDRRGRGTDHAGTQPEPAATRGMSALRTIDATGHVHANAKGKKPEERVRLDSDTMTISLAPDAAGKLQANRLVARDHVVTHFTDGAVHGTMQTELLDAALNPRDLTRKPRPEADGGPASRPAASRPAGYSVTRVDPATNPAEPPTVTTDPFADAWLPIPLTHLTAPAVAASQPAGAKPLVRQMLAEKGVEIDLDNPPRHISAARMAANVETDSYEFFGAPGIPVVVKGQGATITGDKVVMARDGRTMDVPLPGTFEFVSVATSASGAPAPASPASGKPPAGPAGKPKPEKGPMHVTVTWTDHMHFDGLANSANFVGNVVSLSSQAAEQEVDTSRLTCADLRLDFLHLSDKDLGSPSSAPAGKPSDEQAKGIQQVKTAAATGHVRFEADAVDPKDAKKLLTRESIVGDAMNFEGGTVQEVRVPGKGSMLLEDYRPDSAPPAGAGGSGASGVSGGAEPAEFDMSGRGQTVIQWAGRMLMSRQRHEMIADDQVQLLHTPPAPRDSLQIDCNHLAADMSQADGMGSMTDTGQHAKIKAFYADGAVRVLTKDRRADTDDLSYVATDNTMLLLADKGRLTQVVEHDQNPITAQAFLWDRVTKRMTAIDPGRAAIPMKEGVGPQREHGDTP